MKQINAVYAHSRWWVCATVLMVMAVGLIALAWSAFTPPAARVVYNASDSVPIGWYRVLPLDTRKKGIPVGSIVLIDLPTSIAKLADHRGYLPLDIPLLKRVGAVTPQRVCVSGDIVRIDGVPVATALPADAQGRPLPAWKQCRQLVDGELFLLSTTNPASFDSRYFGPLARKSVIGIARRLNLE